MSNKGLIVQIFGYEAIVQDDGSWDIDPMSQFWQIGEGHEYWRSASPRRDASRRAHRDGPAYQTVRELRLLPFSRILDVDPYGCQELPVPHLICDFGDAFGPYRPDAHFGYYDLKEHRQKALDPAKRVSIAFPEAASE
jgi:hypothetical protein